MHAKDPGYVNGVLCMGGTPKKMRLCNKSHGDEYDWNLQARKLLTRAGKYFVDGTLAGVYLGGR
jgi:hypothetical protein